MPIKGKLPLEENPLAEWKIKVGKKFICPLPLHIQSIRSLSARVHVCLFWSFCSGAGPPISISIPFSLSGLWSLVAHFRYMPNTFGLCPGTTKVTAWRIQINHSVKKVWVRTERFREGLASSPIYLFFCQSPVAIFSPVFGSHLALGFPSRTRRFYDIPILT